MSNWDINWGAAVWAAIGIAGAGILVWGAASTGYWWAPLLLTVSVCVGMWWGWKSRRSGGDKG